MAIGSTDTDLILDKPARLFIVRDYTGGEVYDPENQDVYYRSAGQDWKKISQECTWEYTLAGLVKTTEVPINLTFPGMCYERDSYGTHIWTYHFTEFAVMVPDYDPDDPDGDPIGGHTGTNLWLLITGDSVTVGSPANVTFDDVHVQSTTQNADVTLSGTGNYFYVDDMLGADEGYNTTLQMSNLTAAGGGSIPLENIGLHIPLGAPTVIEGSENSRVTYDTALNNDWNFFSDTPYSFIYRQNALNDGLLGRYGLLPYFRIVVPGFQHLGVYTGTLTYTLL